MGGKERRNMKGRKVIGALGGGGGNNGGKRCLPLVFAGSLFIIFLHRYKLILNISSSRLLHFIAFPPPAHETS